MNRPPGSSRRGGAGLILSHQHQFIFVRCRKTASTSLEIALSRICGPHDIITPIRGEDEVLRERLGGRPPQNYRSQDGTMRFYNHMPAAEIRILSGERTWSSYFRWCVERNPWDKVVSMYYHRHPRHDRPPLRTFVASGASVRPFNYRLYTIGGERAVDRIIRYEDLPAELELLASMLNIPAQALELPRAKAAFRDPQRRPYVEEYEPWTRYMVAYQFAEEIAMHHYRFSPTPLHNE